MIFKVCNKIISPNTVTLFSTAAANELTNIFLQNALEILPPFSLILQKLQESLYKASIRLFLYKCLSTIPKNTLFWW
jgi:hypothetical protein